MTTALAYRKSPSLGTTDLPDFDDEPPFLDESEEDRLIRGAADWLRQRIACGPILRHELLAAGRERGHAIEHLLAAYYDLGLRSEPKGEGYLVRATA